MTTNRIPGFSAEASLSEADRHYSTKGHRLDYSFSSVQPASLRPRHEDFCTICEDGGGVCIRTRHGNFCA